MIVCQSPKRQHAERWGIALTNWGVSLPALLIAVGLVLLLVALQTVLSQYGVLNEQSAEPPSSQRGVMPLAFPHIITPYGTAALILLLAASDRSRIVNVFAVFIAVMALNLLAMWFARPIVKYGSGLLRVIGAVLGVLQVALAIQMILGAARMLGILPQSGG